MGIETAKSLVAIFWMTLVVSCFYVDRAEGPPEKICMESYAIDSRAEPQATWSRTARHQ